MPPTHTTAPNMCRARATAVMSELRIPRDEGYMLAHLTCQAPHRPPTLRRHPRDSHIRHGADVERHGAMRPAGRVKNVRMGDFNRPPLSRQAKTACRNQSTPLLKAARNLVNVDMWPVAQLRFTT